MYLKVSLQKIQLCFIFLTNFYMYVRVNLCLIFGVLQQKMEI